MPILNTRFFRKCIFLVCMTVFLSSPLFCAPKKTKKKTSDTTTAEADNLQTEQNKKAADDSNSTDGKIDTSEAVKLEIQKRTFFHKIDEQIVLQVENGTPQSLKNAMQKIKKSEDLYEENEKVLISIATEIMKNVWPSQKITWEPVEANSENSYLGAINSAKQGFFDSSTGNVDFLSTLLPALVIVNPFFNLNNPQASEILENCHNAIKNAMKMNENSILAKYLMAVYLVKNHKYEEALPYFKDSYDQSSDTDEIALGYADCLYKTGKLQLAQEILNKFNLEENNIEVLKQKAYVSFDLKNYDDAEMYVAKVLQQNPNNLEFLLFRAKILVEKKDYIKAVSLLDVYARQDDSSLDYLILRTKIQLDWSKNTTAATETIEKALQLYPDNIEVLMLAAKISSLTDLPVAGKYADELTEIVFRKEPENTEAMTYALNALMQRENWNESYKICKKIIDTQNFSSEIVTKFVQICFNLNKHSEAFDFSKTQLAKHPEDEDILKAYIFAYSKVGNRDVVLKYIDSLLPDASSKMKSYLYYVRSFLQITEDKSLADLRSSLSMNPRNSDALFRLYEIYYEKKDYRKAQYYLRQVVAINPNNNSIKQLNEALTKLVQ